MPRWSLMATPRKANSDCHINFANTGCYDLRVVRVSHGSPKVDASGQIFFLIPYIVSSEFHFSVFSFPRILLSLFLRLLKPICELSNSLDCQKLFAGCHMVP